MHLVPAGDGKTASLALSKAKIPNREARYGFFSADADKYLLLKA